MLDRGLERAIGHVTTAAYVEIEAFCIYNLVAAMEKGLVAAAPIWTDVKTFPAQQFYGKIHGIIGGYPCQPFSSAGLQRGADDPRHLYPSISNIIAATRPAWCWFENVANHLHIGFDAVHTDLSRMGYHVEAGIYSALEVGAPHVRRRLYILALDNTYRQRCKKITADNQYQYWAQTDYQEIRKEIWGSTGRPGNDWPAPPGEEQRVFEERRIIKSGMGCTINGYNFRDDLLRMYGNGVVEQTAAIAFQDLLQKHRQHA